jgi:hypothetical protein
MQARDMPKSQTIRLILISRQRGYSGPQILLATSG